MYVQSNCLVLSEIKFTVFSDQLFDSSINKCLLVERMRFKLPQHSSIISLEFDDNQARILLVYSFYVEDQLKHTMLEIDFNGKMLRKRLVERVDCAKYIYYQDYTPYVLIAMGNRVQLLGEHFNVVREVETHGKIKQIEQLGSVAVLLDEQRVEYDLQIWSE